MLKTKTDAKTLFLAIKIIVVESIYKIDVAYEAKQMVLKNATVSLTKKQSIEDWTVLPKTQGSGCKR